MGAGKILILIGALITIASTFFLTFFVHVGDVYAFGLGFAFNIPDIFQNAEANYAVPMGTEMMVVYILAIVYIVFLISGVLQLVGLASRAVAIIGSILPIVVALLIILIVQFGILDGMYNYTRLFWHQSIVDGYFPFDLALGNVSLGTYTLLAGGVLGLIGGIMGTSDF
ncbi:hypothetical protein LCGC14_1048410 [marine sediment metagenome]|uniref:Uncharacterized protein n=1 Tax=marine sediment metagenome TaxID=412755 RepID=A0A0F9MPK6_9ZZZZ